MSKKSKHIDILLCLIIKMYFFIFLFLKLNVVIVEFQTLHYNKDHFLDFRHFVNLIAGLLSIQIQIKQFMLLKIQLFGSVIITDLTDP